MLPNPVKCNSCNCGFISPLPPFSLTWTYRYVNKDRAITKRIVQHAEKRGIRGLFITVDAPQLGRREKVKILGIIAAYRQPIICRT
jgi:L-lactate dehydrogenase (cytochrome)